MDALLIILILFIFVNIGILLSNKNISNTCIKKVEGFENSSTIPPSSNSSTSNNYTPRGTFLEDCINDCSLYTDSKENFINNDEQCTSICSSCNNPIYCKWLNRMTDEVIPEGENTFICIPGSNEVGIIILPYTFRTYWVDTWDNSSLDNTLPKTTSKSTYSPTTPPPIDTINITSFAIQYFKTDDPISGIKVETISISSDEIDKPIKAIIKHLENDQDYTFTVFANINNQRSKLSQPIIVTPQPYLKLQF